MQIASYNLRLLQIILHKNKSFFKITVMFSDLEKISSEKLQNSKLRIVPQAITGAGESIHLEPIDVLPINQERNEVDSLFFDSYLEHLGQYLEISR